MIINSKNVDLYLSESAFTLNVLTVPLTALGFNPES